eukprot:gene34559-biopygen33364
MQGFPVKTPKEFDKDAQVPRAVPPNPLSRKFHLLASHLRSSTRTCSQIAAILLAQRAIDLPKDIDNLLALEEIEGKEPTEPVRHPTEVNEHQCEDTPGTVAQEMGDGTATCPEHPDDKELPLDEMPDGVVDHTTARCAAAACVSDSGVMDFSEHGHVRAGTIQTRAYDALRVKMKDHLTEDQTLQMAQVQPICKLVNATLHKDESKAVYQKPRKYSPGEQEIIDIHWKELLDYGFIEPAAEHCKHASNVVVTGKKDHETGLWTQTRFCVDLRGINRHSLKDNTLPHRPEELYQKVAKARFKTTLDATKAFHQIPMATDEDRAKTTFWWKNQLYRYTSMPFGAAGATSAFVRIMDYELRHLQHCTVAYVDDVVVYTDPTPEQYLKDVEEVLRTLGDAGIRLHAGKSTFGAATVDFLGYRIRHNSIGAQEAKCKAIQDLPKPQDKTGLRSILGMMNYYKGLVGKPGGPNYSEMARPLNDLLKKEITDIKGAWGKEQDQALQDLKDSL